MASYPHLGAFESINIHGSGYDVLATTRHDELWRDDLTLLADAGLLDLRYPIPWHRIEQRRGEYDWSWIDGPLRWMEEQGMRPILDPLHHVSFPKWLTGGFAHPEFPELYTHFVEQVAQRYEWVGRYTVFNEPLPTVLLCSHMGIWYPYARSDRDFVRMVVSAGRAICLASARLRSIRPDVELVQIDSCEHHRALDVESVDRVAHVNERRFLFHDLVCGHIHEGHALWPYLSAHGFLADEAKWIADHAEPFSVLGLDYYPHSEIDWGWSKEEQQSVIRFPCSHGLGFAAVGREYVQRFGTPVALTETNLGGTVQDRVVWLKIMERQAELLAAESDFRGFCWFPSIDATDWSSLCTAARFDLSPMGIWSLDEQRERRPSELSDWYVCLSQGRATWRDLPEYPLVPPLDHDLHGFLHLLRDV